MDYRKLYVPLLLSVLITLPFFLSGCNDSENEKISCRILSVNKEGITEEYTYNADNKVQTVLRKYSDDFMITGTLEYNDRGQLTKYTLIDNDHPSNTTIFEFIYEGEDKPQKMRFWRANDPLHPLAQTYNFRHESGRLTALEIVYETGTTLRRFEYDKNDNVTRVFLKNDDSPEQLTTENLTFDNNASLYAQAPELETINVYGEFALPNKNNVLTAKVYREPKEPLLVTFEPTYDERGLIISNLKLNEGATGITEFSEVMRDCK